MACPVHRALRTLLALAIVAAASAGALQAQLGPRHSIRALGGAAGASLASGSAESDPAYGLSLGAQVVVPVAAAWALVPELLLVDKGGRDAAGPAAITADLRALDASLLVRWNTGGLEVRRRVFAFAGPTVGYFVSCDAGSAVGGAFGGGDCLDAVNRTDIGLTAGGGLEFPSSLVDWGISLRYQHGIADILKGSGAVRTRTVQLLLSYRL